MAQMMATQAGDPGAFRAFDLARVPSPCFVVDAAAVARNLEILSGIGAQGKARVLCALKAFSMPALAPLIMEHLDGTCASGLFEARMGRCDFGGELATYCAAFKATDMAEIADLSDHVIFNSPLQRERFAPILKEAARPPDVGLRINPEHSEGEIARYDPCAPRSRLGFPVSDISDEVMDGIAGLHMHTLCEQGFPPLLRTWNAVQPKIARYSRDLKWINFGGGHHITRADYDRAALIDFLTRVRAETGCDIYLEPGEAVALDAGILVGEILDLPRNGMDLAITDISATCHMPDVLEAPYRPALLQETGGLYRYRLGGPSCLAGDVIGDYAFEAPLSVGERIAFLDQAHYSMVKTNTFNGVPLPAIAVWDSRTDALRIVREFGYDDFRGRLA